MSKSGLYSAILAYCLWGAFPLFWKQLSHVPSNEILAHRMVWSTLFLLAMLFLVGKWREAKATLSSRPFHYLLRFSLAAVFLSINWGVYVWSVNAGYIVESSLGYFINPLLNVLLGVIVFRERLRPWQWIALLMAVCGVLYLTIEYGKPPVIALTLAFSFAMYGLLKKTAPLDAIAGLSLETSLMFLPALGYLIWIQTHGSTPAAPPSLSTTLLLACGGVVTAAPLLLFAYGAKRIPFSLLGILQYIAPTGQFLLGLLLYNESFGREQAIAYGLVWAGLIVYSADSLTHYNKQKRRSTQKT